VSQTLAPPPPAGAPGGGSRLRGIDWRSYAIYIGFAVVFLLFAIFLGGDGFLSGTNLLNIFRQTAIISVMAVAMTFVIASAQIDLSVGSVAGLSSVVAAIALSHWGLLAGIIGGLAVGLVVGAINGGLVATLGIPSFLVTLGMLGIASGVAQWVTASAPQPILNDAFNLVFGSGNIGPVPGLIVWSAIFVAVGHVALTKTRYGREVLATGGNRTAADFTGINTKRVKFQVLLISAVVASIAGLLYAGRLQSGRFQWGTGDELSAIAAVILGGTSFVGGIGSIWGTLVGALIIAVMSNGLILTGVPDVWQYIVKGLVIIGAVTLDRFRQAEGART